MINNLFRKDYFIKIKIEKNIPFFRHFRHFNTLYKLNNRILKCDIILKIATSCL